MRYQGGKANLAAQIAGYLNAIRRPGQTYWEPFVGGASVASRIRGEGQVLLSDLRPELIALLQAVRDGWDPPAHVTEEEYDRAKAHPEAVPPHLLAFIGIGCSYGGRWFIGYARAEGQDQAAMARRSLKRKVARLPDQAELQVLDFLQAEPDGEEWLIYCDPPYQDTAGYGGLAPFDHAAFWERVRDLEGEGHTVIVSEERAPADFTPVLRLARRRRMERSDTTRGWTGEALWRWRETMGAGPGTSPGLQVAEVV